MTAHPEKTAPAGTVPSPVDEIEPHESREEIKANEWLCTKICLWLGLLTFITVGVALIPFPMWGHIVVALAIATLKAALVVMFFMHFLHEKITIYQFMALTVVFAVALFGLTWLAWWDPIELGWSLNSDGANPPAPPGDAAH